MLLCRWSICRCLVISLYRLKKRFWHPLGDLEGVLKIQVTFPPGEGRTNSPGRAWNETLKISEQLPLSGPGRPTLIRENDLTSCPNEFSNTFLPQLPAKEAKPHDMTSRNDSSQQFVIDCHHTKLKNADNYVGPSNGHRRNQQDFEDQSHLAQLASFI